MPCPICDTLRIPGKATCGVCGYTFPQGTTLPQGSVLQGGHYAIEAVLGEGGFGITYRASDAKLRRSVAIKELFPSGSYRHGLAVMPASGMSAQDFEMARQGFLTEARILATFHLPSIVQVLAHFEENGTAYLVMEYLEGETLKQRISSGQTLPPGDVESLARAIASVLKEVHSRDLLHRDITPGNIMFERSGRTVLIDFGSVRAFASGKTVNHTRLVTPGYAPLEQYAGAAKLGPYTDLYSLGATLYEALSGHPPPDAAQRSVDQQSLPALPRTTPPGLNLAITAALQMKVQDRPQTADEFLDLLDHVKATTAPRPKPPSHGPGRPADILHRLMVVQGVQTQAELERLVKSGGLDLSALAPDVLETLRRMNWLPVTGAPLPKPSGTVPKPRPPALPPKPAPTQRPIPPTWTRRQPSSPTAPSPPPPAPRPVPSTPAPKAPTASNSSTPRPHPPTWTPRVPQPQPPIVLQLIIPADLQSLWSAIAAVPLPESHVSIPGSTSSLTNARIRAVRIGARLASAALFLGSGILFFSGLWLLAVPSFLIGVYVVSGSQYEGKPVILRRIRAIDESLLLLGSSYVQAINNYETCRQDLEAIYNSVLNGHQLLAERRAEVAQQELKLLIEEALAHAPIQAGVIPGVGAKRVQTLRAHGITSAAKINRKNLSRVSGIGEAIAKDLLQWRANLERQVRSTTPSPEQVETLAVKSTQQEIDGQIRRLRQGDRELKALLALANSAAVEVQTRAQDLQRERLALIEQL